MRTTVDELKEKKKNLSEAILFLVKNFEKETGALVEAIMFENCIVENGLGEKIINNKTEAVISVTV